ncbi:DUF1161 domain-containing protein [Undibacterium sp. FT79W]|uniref:DUF1161 domain-containing protein n=1 Tax=Undibacterium sp. FT79W TaxID=2762296 RepID=UPI00164ACF84|nr:DUF1161 domain-containing protein [Undibacterium sp. FT79W]MBC3877415.1 DUF1161 domain-containing protein [Undibacterium sp. FT79W]
MRNPIFTKSLVSGLLLCSASSWAAVTPCEAIMDKINAKLEGKGVSDYALKVVPKDTETKLRVVGVCEGGSKKIIYQKQKAKKKTDE